MWEPLGACEQSRSHAMNTYRKPGAGSRTRITAPGLGPWHCSWYTAGVIFFSLYWILDQWQMWRKTADTSSNPEERCFLNRKKIHWRSVPSVCVPCPSAAPCSSRCIDSVPSTAHRFTWWAHLRLHNLIWQQAAKGTPIASSYACHQKPATHHILLSSMEDIISCLSLQVANNKRQGGFRGNPLHQKHLSLN